MSRKIDKTALREIILNVDGLSDEDKSQILELLSEQKKYGLVWEDSTETVVEKLKEDLPVLEELEEKRILNDTKDQQNPNHIIIEGDNYQALFPLLYTHEGKIDIIYIDPPYNTGNKDFIYNDSFVDKEDSFRHSKWLSFMERRLKLAKKLLSDKGVIFISIDDNEQAPLKLLCDEIFGENNFIGQFKWNKVAKASSLSDTIRTKYEYILCYKKNNTILFKGKDSYNTEAPLWHNPNRPQQYLFPKRSIKLNKSFNKDELIISKYKVRLLDDVICQDGFNKDDVRIIASCAWSQDKINNYVKKGGTFIVKRSFGTMYYCMNPEESFIPPADIISKEECNVGTNTNAKEMLDEMGVEFNYSKPESLVRYLINMVTYFNPFSKILDFFAGSGTTLHATMQLNKEDGGKRQCILVTNNENNICEEVTYERNKRVIQGYTKPNGEIVGGLKENNLRYYKVGFVPRDSSIKGKRQLMEVSTDLLCIKNDLYEERFTFGNIKLRSNIARYFEDDRQRMLIIYKEEAIPSLVEEIDRMSEDTHIKVYVFSANNYAMHEDFTSVEDKVSLCALPSAIYNAYLKVLPKKINITIGEEENI